MVIKESKSARITPSIIDRPKANNQYTLPRTNGQCWDDVAFPCSIFHDIVVVVSFCPFSSCPEFLQRLSL